MKKILFLLMFLCGCTYIGYNDLHQPKNPNTNLLPAMKTKVNTLNLKAAFTDTTNDKDKIKRDERDIIVDDAVNIFEREVEQNITVGDGEKKGYIAFRIQYVDLEKSLPIRVVSIATLGIANIFGFPAAKFTQTMEVEVEVTDRKQNVIKRYTETVENSAYVALYWGYRRKEVNRKLAAENVKQALKIISAKINVDAPEIKQKLQ